MLFYHFCQLMALSHVISKLNLGKLIWINLSRTHIQLNLAIPHNNDMISSTRDFEPGMVSHLKSPNIQGSDTGGL